uniref:Uncharacterized protein n=1 Tax=Amphimedon queenslandica TaxID=400682 RepID=A0A1X7T4B5_AMPQE
MTLKRNKGGYKCHRCGSTQHTLFVTVHSEDGEQQKKLARGAESEDSNKIRKSHGSTPCRSPVHTILQRSETCCLEHDVLY